MRAPLNLCFKIVTSLDYKLSKWRTLSQFRLEIKEEGEEN